MTNLSRGPAVNGGELFILTRLREPSWHPAAQHVPGTPVQHMFVKEGQGAGRALRGGVRMGMCRGTSAILHFKAIAFLLFPLRGCPWHSCSQRGWSWAAWC